MKYMDSRSRSNGSKYDPDGIMNSLRRFSESSDSPKCNPVK